MNEQSTNEDTPIGNLAEYTEGDEQTKDQARIKSPRLNPSRYWAVLALITYLAGLGTGYILKGRLPAGDGAASADAPPTEHAEMNALLDQVNPPDGYELPIQYGDFAPRLIAAGAIDYTRFVSLYRDIGSPLTEEQLGILAKGSNAAVIINKENQHFLLNLFWALGLANRNKILTDGPMLRGGMDNVVNFASTGGWTLAAKPIADLYAGQPIIPLTAEQQERLEEVAAGVYRPCCDNPTSFPDCNHGMAMLGLLELMASQGASVAEMFETAKYVNAFWFQEQALELAILFKSVENLDFAQIDGSQFVGQQLFSGSGSRAVHQWLAQNGKLEQAPGSSNSCAVQ